MRARLLLGAGKRWAERRAGDGCPSTPTHGRLACLPACSTVNLPLPVHTLTWIPPPTLITPPCSSDMKMLIQEACQGPVRDAFKASGAQLDAVTADALRPVVLRDFQVSCCSAVDTGLALASGCWAVRAGASRQVPGSSAGASPRAHRHGSPFATADGGARAKGVGGAGRDRAVRAWCCALLLCSCDQPRPHPFHPAHPHPATATPSCSAGTRRTTRSTAPSWPPRARWRRKWTSGDRRLAVWWPAARSQRVLTAHRPVLAPLTALRTVQSYREGGGIGPGRYSKEGVIGGNR